MPAFSRQPPAHSARPDRAEPHVIESLRQLLDEPPPHLRRPSELTVLKQTVKGLYHNTRAWVAEEDESRQLVAWLHDKVGLLQRAFHSLSDVLVEEVDSLRCRADQQAAELDEALRQAREVARLKQERIDPCRVRVSGLAASLALTRPRPLAQELTVPSQARADHTALASELARHRAGEAGEVQRMSAEVAAVREEIAEVRAASQREARAERAARVKIQEYVAGLESRLERQDALLQAHAQELKLARAVLSGLDAESRYEQQHSGGGEDGHISAEKRRQWREQVHRLAEEPELQHGTRNAAAASYSSRYQPPTYLRATKPLYDAA